MCSCQQMKSTHSCYKMQQGRRPCSRSNDSSSSLPLLPLVTLNIISQPRRLPSHTSWGGVFFFDTKSFFFFFKECGWGLIMENGCPLLSRLRNWEAFPVSSTCLSHFFPGGGGRICQISPGWHVIYCEEGRNLSRIGNKIYEANSSYGSVCTLGRGLESGRERRV